MADDKVFVPFVCQRCSQSLRLDESLNSISENTSAELNIPIHSIPDVDLESQATSFDHYVAPYRLSDSANVANGFMILSNENVYDLLSHKYKINTVLFDFLSGSSNIDHPLCDECTDYLMELLEQKLNKTLEDHEVYRQYNKTLQEDKNRSPKLSDLEKELSDLEAEECRLLDELDALQKEETETLKEIEKEEAVALKISAQEEVYWKEFTKHRWEWASVEEENKNLAVQLDYTKAQVIRLGKANVYNTTFHIWHQGHFGTINNFRLGRLPSAPVDWSEINAAWGQTALLLSSLARKINLTFDKYKLVPYGNHSYIEVIGEKKELPLYGSGGFKYVWNTKFDHGMAAFLDCLQQFQEKVEKLEKASKAYCFPYRTNKGKIDDKDSSYSIKVQLNSEEQWTKALKFMLTNLKWGLAWVASQFNEKEDDKEVKSDH